MPIRRGSPAVQAMDMASGSISPYPSPSVPTQPNDSTLPVSGPIAVPTPGPIAPVPMQVVHPSLLLVLLDALGTLTVPSVVDVLLLMDTYYPIGPRHAGLREELEEMGIQDVVDLYSLPVELLATFGWLRQSSARRLQDFCRDRILYPLGFVEETVSNNHSISDDSPSIQQMGVSTSEDGQPIDSTVDVVQAWVDEVGTPEEIEEEEIEGEEMSVRSGEMDKGEEKENATSSPPNSITSGELRQDNPVRHLTTVGEATLRSKPTTRILKQDSLGGYSNVQLESLIVAVIVSAETIRSDPNPTAGSTMVLASEQIATVAIHAIVGHGGEAASRDSAEVQNNQVVLVAQLTCAPAQLSPVTWESPPWWPPSGAGAKSYTAGISGNVGARRYSGNSAGEPEVQGGAGSR
ncbi:hypothetical protein H4582DRAFT_2058613 [Lactarius indigo]|nr:hypothetical protein H4582DRAFT_2058613 [Lactarius indigo]